MFKTAAQIADGDPEEPPGSSLFISAANCLTKEANRKDVDEFLSIPQVIGPIEPASKQAPMIKLKPTPANQGPTKTAVQCSPVKRLATSVDIVPPSIMRLLGTVKERLSNNIWRYRNTDLNTYRTNLHILPLRQFRSKGQDASSTQKGPDELLRKHIVSIPKLSSSRPHSSTDGIDLQTIQLWGLLVNNKIYDCLGSNLVNGEVKKYQSTVHTLIKLLDCSDVYFDMINFTHRLLSHQHLLQSLPSHNSHTLFPSPLTPSHILLRALISAREQSLISLELLIPCFVRLLVTYKSQSLLYNPYSDALIGKQKALSRHKELGNPRFCNYISSRMESRAFEQLSVIHGATVFPAFDAVSDDRDSFSMVYDSSHEYELHRLAFLAGTLAEDFSTCKAVAFAAVDNTLLMHWHDEIVTGYTMYTLDAKLLAHTSLGTLEDSKLAGMVVLPYSHELEELILCGSQLYDSVTTGSEDTNFYYNPTISQHIDLITLLYTEMCRYTDGTLTTNRLYLILVTLGLNPTLAGYEWFLLQYQLSIFRLAKTQITIINLARPGPKDSIKSVLNPYTVLIHCMLKYKLEFDSDFVPLLKRIHRQDISANSCTGIYLIVDTRISRPGTSRETSSKPHAPTTLNPSITSTGTIVTEITPPIKLQEKVVRHKNNASAESLEMLITDGFYLVKASVDPLLFNFLTKNKIYLYKHEKILVSLPQTINFGSAQEPPIRADWSTEGTLILTYYNTRPAPRSCFLGRFHRPFISMSLSHAISYALGMRLCSHQASDSNLVPHISVFVLKVFDPIIVIKKVKEKAVAESDANVENEPKSYCYRRVLVIDPNCVDTDTILKLSKDLELLSSNPPQFPCLFLHQFGSRASIMESFEPGLQIELISTGIKRYNPYGRGTEGASSGSYLQLSPSAIICSQSANTSISRELHNALNTCYQNCLFFVYNTVGGLELLCDHTIFFYCLGTSANIPPMYCFRLSDDSSRVFDLIEVIQSTNMSTIFVHSTKEQASENEAIEFRSSPKKLSKLIIKAAILQDKGHGKYRLVCPDEAVIKTTGDLFFYENEEQTNIYVQILEESIHKYL
ncbi:Hypothetical protein GLP15_1982 [Giardia lamblia P15]|uniref:BRCA2 OB1 domain-containing protein n=1 Tax=Giardia intestinalis (strain P15) TaxID=658858 RepID=E1F148_GIAIA|nr:Hypothetical protein GLP15_1982 [Giardia lamblia P15]